MIINTAKAVASMRDLQDRLTIKLANAASGRLNTVRAQNDASGYPMLFLSVGGNESEGQPVIALRIEQIDAVSKDVLGNSMNAYNPHIMQIAYELDSTAQAKVKILDIEKVDSEIFRMGYRLQVLQITSGTAVTEAAMDAATPAEEYEADLYWPRSGS